MIANINSDLKHLARPIDSVSLDPYNARRHPKRSLDAIAASLQKYGQQKPIVALNGILVAGNGTLEAARGLGWTEIAIAEFKGSKKEALAYALADNRTAELSEWNFEKLSDQLGLFENQLELGSFWSKEELDTMQMVSQAEEGGLTPEERKRIFENNAIKQIVLYLEEIHYKEVMGKFKNILEKENFETNTDVVLHLLKHYENTASN